MMKIMKTNRYISRVFFAAVLAAASVSCLKDDLAAPTRKGSDRVTPGGGSSGYSLSISAGRGQKTDTRAYLEVDKTQPDYLSYYWTAGDQISLTVTTPNTLVPLTELNKITLTGTNTGNALHANFRGDLSANQFYALDAQSTVDLYSYYPINIDGLEAGASSFPTNLVFTIPTSYTVTPNTFIDARFAPMVAVEKGKEPNLAFPPDLAPATPVDEIGGIHLNYHHVMSYAAIEMDVRLLPEKVTQIKMTVGGGDNNNTRLSGVYAYNTANGTGNMRGGTSNTVTININGGGLDVGDVIYIPIPPKDLSRYPLNFEFVTAGSSGNKYMNISSTVVSGINFERGKIHPIKVAPSAQYASGTTFTTTKSGYYFIEAWGGDGGGGGKGVIPSSQSAGGLSQRVSGLYYLTKDSEFNIYVGSKGVSKLSGEENGSGQGGAGGTNGFTSGSGGSGGYGYKHNWILSDHWSGAGGGGGAGTFVLCNGTALPENLLIVSGGGGGGGGGSGNYMGTGSTGGTGGNGGAGGTTTSGNGGQASNKGGQGASTFSSTPTGGNGGNGQTSTAANAPGGGGGGGGGGYDYGGNGGSGGERGGNSSCQGGGGGKGGRSYVATQQTKPGFAESDYSHVRPTGRTDGYVVITFIR